MNHSGTTVRTSIELALEPAAAFALVVEELTTALHGMGIRFTAGASGCVTQGAAEVGHVVSWQPDKSIALRWQPAYWDSEETTEMELRFEPVDGGTRVTLEQRGWGRLLGDDAEVGGWFAWQVAAPFLRATAPEAVADWITDRNARRPSGAFARSSYSDPLFHYPNFRVILEELALTPDDYFLEVGCGGGALLREALKTGCRAAAIDHSPDMVRAAREGNREAVEEGRLEIVQADAHQLPFPDGTFTRAAMTSVLGFLQDPVKALGEIRRVLKDDGRMVILGSDPEGRGTPAAPEPMVSRLRFYEDDELERLGRDAGFSDVQVVRRDLAPFAREVGVPDEHVPLFSRIGNCFLIARKGPAA